MLELASRRNTATSFDKHILPGATTVDLCLFLYFTPQKVNILLLHRALSETSPTLNFEELESGKYGIPPQENVNVINNSLLSVSIHVTLSIL